METIHPDHYQSTTGSPAVPLIAYAAREGKGDVTRWHSHETAQLFHVISGSLAVDTELGTYFVPPERAVWLPGGVRHETRYLSETEGRYLYFSPSLCEDLPETPRVLQVTTLLRELILAFMSYPRQQTFEGAPARLGGVILDQLRLLPSSPLRLPMPQDRGLRTVCEEISGAVDRPPALAEAARRSGLSVRSFERHLQRQTGLNYRSWCRQAKLFKALEYLAQGLSVSDVSHALGYQEPSAFVVSFRKAFGVTPGRYFS